jgi:hypothetical protein
MAKSLNFNNVKKQYLSVTLSDEKETLLMIGTPTKAVMDDLYALRDKLKEVDENDTDIEVSDDLYNTCAKVMSRNKGGIKITGDYLADIFDYEDIIIFFNAYTGFIDEVLGSKN